MAKMIPLEVRIADLPEVQEALRDARVRLDDRQQRLDYLQEWIDNMVRTDRQYVLDHEPERERP